MFIKISKCSKSNEENPSSFSAKKIDELKCQSEAYFPA